MSITLNLVDFQKAQDVLKQELERFMGDKFVTVGIHEEAGNIEDGTMTMAGLGALQHFGGDIDHPGGTSYGYTSRKAAEDGKVRFLKPGKGYMVLGQTEAHVITIPARPWLDVGVASGTQKIVRAIRSAIANGKTPDETLEIIGLTAVGAVKKYMTDLKTPPNAPSTIRKKKSSNPLIDTGAMRASVTHSIVQQKPEEGL